jgi:exonuclease VII small subunit
MNLSNLLASPREDPNFCNQMELPINTNNSPESEILTAIYDLLLLQEEKMDKQQLYLMNLSQGILEILTILSQDDKSDTGFTDAIKALEEHVKLLEKGIVKTYQHLEKDTIGVELKSGQQALQEALALLMSSKIETSQKKSASNISYLDWKQIATIITAAAIIASLCSLAVFQIASNLKTDQKTSIPTEKLLKPKKDLK